MSQTKRGTPAPEPGQAWGVLGGAFDPIHLGHLNLARQIRSHCRLDGVLFVPAVRPPHRDTVILSPYQIRLEMTRIGVSDTQECLASSIEEDKQLSGYTIDTLFALKSEFPQTTFDLIVGADQAQVFDTWNRPQEILSLSRLLVGVRPGYPVSIPEGLDFSRISVVQIEPKEISSSDIRRRVAIGATESDLASLVPAAVAEYIVKNRLYQA